MKALRIAACLALGACSTSADLSDFPIVDDPAPCGFHEPVATRIDISRRVDIFHGTAFARIEGIVLDGVAGSVHELVASEGACRYLEYVAPSCDPGCASNETCDVGGVCVRRPEEISGGTLFVRGLATPDDPVVIDAYDFAPGTYDGSSLPADLFAADTVVAARFTANGLRDSIVGVHGVSPMDPELTTTMFQITDGADAEITWTVGSDPNSCVRVVLNGFNASHGLPLGDIIECEGPDDGSLTIPRSLIERFPEGQTPDVTEGFDWPHSELTRYTRSVAGAVELTLRSTTYFQLSH